MTRNNPGPERGPVPPVPILPDETGRLQALHSYHILDTAEEKDFDDLTALASAICQTPIALISLIDQDRQWFKSHKGLADSETPRAYSFCAHAIASPDKVMIIEDASKDSRFSSNPFVVGEPHIVFYAGVPLVNNDGFALGTLCVVDSQIRELSAEQINALMVVARQVIDKLELRKKIAELEASKRSVSRSEQRFKNLVSQAPVAIAVYTGPDRIIEQANEKMLQVWGRQADVIGQPLLTARPEMADHPYMAVLEEVFSTGIPHQGFAIKGPVMIKGLPVERYFDASYQPLAGEDGKVTGVIVVASDVTDRKEDEQKKDDFISIASHELKTPLTVVKATMQLLDIMKDEPASPLHTQLLDQANRSVGKMISLIDDLLNVTRMSETKLSLNKTDFTIADMLHTCCNHIRIAGRHELILLGDKDLRVHADEHRIDQVVVNFVNNAVKYAPDSKEIFMNVEKQEGMAKVSVRDQGPGIAPEKLPHLFDRYYRASHAGSQYSGLGLGLYICAQIIKRHGGTIGVESQPGQGATFWFTLPLPQ